MEMDFLSFIFHILRSKFKGKPLHHIIDFTMDTHSRFIDNGRLVADKKVGFYYGQNFRSGLLELRTR